MTILDARVVRALERSSRAGGAACAVVGLVALLGWAFDVTVLQRLWPGFASMKPNSALGFVLSGVAVWRLRPDVASRRREVQVLGGAVALIGGATLLEYRTGSLGIDQLVFRDAHSPAGVLYPGRMSPMTATGFLLAGVALVLAEPAGRRRKIAWAQVLGVCVTLFGLLALLGYLYDAQSLYRFGPYAAVALHTALAFLVLGAAIVCSWPERGPVRALASDSPGGLLARRLLPAVIAIPTLLGWLRLEGQRAGLFDTAFGLTLYASANVVIFAAFLWWNADALARADQERRTTEAALRKSEDDLRITLDSIADGVFATDAGGRVVRMNHVAERLTGTPYLAAQGRPLREVLRLASAVPGDPSDAILDEILEESDHAVGREALLVSASGSRCPVGFSSAPIRDHGGAARGVVLVARDLTRERTSKRQVAIAVEHLREVRVSEAMFRGLLEAAPDAVVISEEGGRILLVNGQTERLFGFDRAELVGASIDTLVPERLRGVRLAQRTRLLADSESRPLVPGLDVHGLRKDGTEFPVEVSLGRLQTERGLLVSTSIRDVTERRKVDDQRARLAAIVDSSDDAIIGDTLEGIITSWNRGAARLFGYTAEEIIGKPITILVPAGREHEQRDVLGEIARGGHVDSFDTQRRRKDGALIHVSVTSSPVLDSHGTVVGASKIVRDITERKLAQRNLADAKDAAEAASRELEAFSYSVAHDLRAPLRGMSGFAQLLLERYEDRLDDEARDWLAEISANAKRMGELIDGLLSLARTTRSDLHPETTDLTRLARDTVEHLMASDDARSVDVVVQDGLAARVDPRLARALLQNLLGNAWKFTTKTPHPRIEFGAEDAEGTRAFFVRDNGAGFDMSYANKLFSPFQRLHSAGEFPGTGIGLATVARIVHRHGGRIWAEAAVDRGATFHFTFRAGE